MAPHSSDFPPSPTTGLAAAIPTGLPAPLVFRYGRVGDMVLLAPLLGRLHRRYGRPCRLVGSGAWSESLYAGHPDVAEVWALRQRHRPLLFSPERWRLLRLLRGAAGGPVYVAETEPRALAKIRRLLALARIDPAHCVFIVDTAAAPQEHWADRLLRFGAATPAALQGRIATDPLPPRTAAPLLPLRADEASAAAAWLQARGYSGRPLFLLQPANKRSMRWNGARAADDDDKYWPPAHWSQIARSLAQALPDSIVLLCGCAAEKPLLDAIARASGLPQVAVSTDLSLRELLAVAARARGMVSVDTGPAHIAAAAGCPLVVLFGAASPANWLPRSAAGTAVLALGGPPHSSRAIAISVEEVTQAARRAFLLG